MIMMIIFLVSMLLSFALILINSSISVKLGLSREKNSPFECGYDPKSMSRLPFSLHFFLLAVVFLIFDVEITIIMPLPLAMKFMDMMLWTSLCLIFILILLVGTIHEWNEGSLEWTK